MTRELPTVLVVDDKRNMLRLMGKVLRGDAHVLTAETGADAVRLLSDEAIDCVLCDLKIGDMTGLEVLKVSKQKRPQAPFVLMTAYATVGTAVEALKLGAFDYLAKPFAPDEARQVIVRALTHVAISEPTAGAEVLPGLVARSKQMNALATVIRKISKSDATTLLLGETGTGKERVARAIHQLGARASGRFVALNCAAIPRDLLESELFGHKRGAFTGAIADRRGLFEEATGGTLFLDEIGDMPLSLQAKLTRVLEERTVRRVGETTERAIDVRLVAATHRDIEKMVKLETFREDLFYRLNVALVRIPPLRERRDDIPLLAHHFLRAHAEGAGPRSPKAFSAAALDALCAYGWPGNVRQLRSAVERATVIGAGDEIEVGDLPPEISRPDPLGADGALLDGTWSEALDRGRAIVGRRYLEALLDRYDGQVAEAAAHAGVERESFYRLLRKHGVDPHGFREPPKK